MTLNATEKVTDANTPDGGGGNKVSAGTTGLRSVIASTGRNLSSEKQEPEQDMTDDAEIDKKKKLPYIFA